MLLHPIFSLESVSRNMHILIWNRKMPQKRPGALAKSYKLYPLGLKNEKIGCKFDGNGVE
jgi:hypothetical protein